MTLWNQLPAGLRTCRAPAKEWLGVSFDWGRGSEWRGGLPAGPYMEGHFDGWLASATECAFVQRGDVGGMRMCGVDGLEGEAHTLHFLYSWANLHLWNESQTHATPAAGGVRATFQVGVGLCIKTQACPPSSH